jgi:uncharacterized protein (TIGR03437 family)
VKKTLMSEVLKLGTRIAQVRTLTFLHLCVDSGRVCLWSPHTNKESVRVVMYQAKFCRLLMSLFASASLFMVTCGLASAQQVALSLGSASALRGKSISLNLSLATSGGAQPTVVQWTIAYPASAVSSVSVTPGAAATAASKSVTCSSGTGKTMCIVFGAGDDAVGTGVLATATLNLAAGTAVVSAPVQLASVAAISATDSSIPASAIGRLIATRQASAAATRQESSVSSAVSAAATMFDPASGVAGDVCSPGGFASLSGEGFTSQDPQKATSLPLPTSLANVQVKVNGEAAPMLFASASQVNFQCPQLTPGSPLDVTLIAENGSVMTAASSTMAAAAPSVFTVGETTQGVIRIASANQIAMPKTEGTPSRPASPGENLEIYVDGLGEVMNAVPAGSGAADNQIQLRNQIRIFVGDVQIAPASAEFAPGTPGVFQIDARLPQNVPTGLAVPLHVQVLLPDGSVAESNQVTLAIAAVDDEAGLAPTP